MNRFFRLKAAILALFLLAGPAPAHEGHKEDMTDAEMAQMEAMANQLGMPSPEEMIHHEGEEMHAPAPPPISAEEALQAAIEKNRATSASDFLGRLHPVAAHFPIALLLVAFLAELALMARPGLGLEPTVRFLVAGGAIGAALAALLGWFAAGWRLSDRSEILAIHRWNGTGIALVALVTAWFALRDAGRTRLRIGLFILAAALIMQGYYGGEMVFGPNHMGIR
ncbi:DUF2231 domain-containing protein [Sphingomicrobium lutaoense]|uniref:Putative membrane protein n=1 Tax=Sphingomicrobium lutaoense TaxID=515949 RepID=A0A839Z5H9_9SPHN|nr:DUF2231 domain-containing protein [Sphingomicrobium lutaoense]MBB3764925.1 putative membrane protein [Sphingomicrobium lutaoense]